VVSGARWCPPSEVLAPLEVHLILPRLVVVGECTAGADSGRLLLGPIVPLSWVAVVCAGVLRLELRLQQQWLHVMTALVALVRVEKVNRVGDSFAVSVVDVASVTLVVFECRPQVPSKFSVRIPVALLMWLFVHDHLGSWRYEWVPVVVEGSE
jgi:hypothetical protein